MTKKKRKKYRVRWGRLLILIGIVALIIAIPLFIIRSCLGLPSLMEREQADNEAALLSPQMLRCDSIMKQRLDSLFNTPQRLDTNDIAISVFDITSGIQVYSRHSSDTLAPASCMKIATALASLKTLGFDHRYYESLQVRGTMVGDTLRGNLLLRADDDPLLETFDDLIAQLHRTGIRHIDGNIYLDLAKEDTLRAHPSAKTWDIPFHKTPLMLKGRGFIERTLVYSLRAGGITYRHNTKIKPQGKYRVVAQSSHLLRDVVTPMLIHSSNIKAESILYHMDWKAGLTPNHRQRWDITHRMEDYLRTTFASDTATLRRIVVNDGSGLSPHNRLTADFLVQMLCYAYNDGQMRDYLINEGLATPGSAERRGSLLSRLSKAEYVNRIFVKTGTLTTIGTSSLAGYIHGFDDHWYVFAIINSDSPVAESRIFQDKVCKLFLKQ